MNTPENNNPEAVSREAAKSQGLSPESRYAFKTNQYGRTEIHRDGRLWLLGDLHGVVPFLNALDSELQRITELVVRFMEDFEKRLDYHQRLGGELAFQFPMTAKDIKESIALQHSLNKRLLDSIQPSFNFAATSPEIPAASPVSRFVLDEDSDFVCDRLKAEDESGRWLTTAREVFEAFDDAGGNPKVVSAHPVSGDKEAAR